MNHETPLAGKTAIVTGAGRGIGRAIAEGYARAGAAVACAARTRAELDETVAAITDGDGGQAGRALAVPTDVTDPAAVDRLFAATVEGLGGVDILVINAGGNLDRHTVEESSLDDWHATMELNLFGAYLCAKAAIPYMKERGGKIITIGSGMGHKGKPGNTAYCCAKAGLWMLTRVLAEEVWRYGISVNELIPGPVQTSATRHAPDEPGSFFGVESEWIKMPEDVVPLAIFLATQPDIGPTAQSFSLMRRDT